MKKSTVLRILAMLICALMLCTCLASCVDEEDPTSGGTDDPTGDIGNPPDDGTGDPGNGSGGPGGEGPGNGGGNEATQLAYGLYMIGERLVISNYDADGKFLGTSTVNARTMTYDYENRMFVHSFEYGDDGKLKTVNFALGLSLEVFEELTVADGKVTAKGTNIDMELTYDQNGKLVSEIYTNDGTIVYGFDYDEYGRVTREYDGDTTPVYYHIYGNGYEKVVAVDPATMTAEPTKNVYTLSFGAKGNPTKLEMIDSEGNSFIYTWTYNDKGQCIKTQTTDGDLYEMTYGEDGRIKSASGKTVYNANEYMLEVFEYGYTNDGKIKTYSRLVEDTQLDEKTGVPVVNKFKITQTYNYKDGEPDGYTEKREEYEGSTDKVKRTDIYYIDNFGYTTGMDSIYTVVSGGILYRVETTERGDDNGTRFTEKAYVAQTGKLYISYERVVTYTEDYYMRSRVDVKKYYLEDGETVYKQEVITYYYNAEGTMPTNRVIVTTTYNANGTVAGTDTKEETFPFSVMTIYNTVKPDPTTGDGEGAVDPEDGGNAGDTGNGDGASGGAGSSNGGSKI